MNNSYNQREKGYVMNAILDKLLIFACSITLYLFHADIVYAIIPVILSVLISCLIVYFDSYKINLAANLLFILICFFYPNYVIFLPLFLYDIIRTKYQYFVLVMPFFLIMYREHFNSDIFSFTILFLILTILLKYKTDNMNTLRMEYNELRDNTAEMSRQLKEKNQNILKNQDDEVQLATLNERNRISKEIHDNIGHLLSRALLQLGALLTITKDETLKDGLTTLKESLSAGMDDIRNSIHRMYDESIDLYSQINGIAKDFTFCPIHYEYDIQSPPPLALKHSMIAIVKESLANIMKHSNATKVSIILREHPAMYQLIITDNGTLNSDQKYQLDKIMNRSELEDGIGLRNISDRVKGFGGNLNVILDNGFTLFITIPKKKIDYA